MKSSIFLRSAGTTMIAGAIAGLALFGWGVARTGSGADEARLAASTTPTPAAEFEDLALPTPAATPRLSPQQVLVASGQLTVGDITAVDVQITTKAALLGREGNAAFPGVADSESMWLIRRHGFGLGEINFLNGPYSHPTPAPGAQCSEAGFYLEDNYPLGDGYGLLLWPSKVDGPIAGDCATQADSNLALVRGARALGDDIGYQLPNSAKIETLSFRDAKARMTANGIEPKVYGTAQDSANVYLLTSLVSDLGCSVSMAIISTPVDVLLAGSHPTDCAVLGITPSPTATPCCVPETGGAPEP